MQRGAKTEPMLRTSVILTSMQSEIQTSQSVKDTLWVSAPSNLDLCVFLNIFAICACKLT